MPSIVRSTVAALVCALALALVPGAGSKSAGNPMLSAYRGLATWVDIYDTKSWSHPERAVAAMAAHHVRTLFLETGNYSHDQRVYRQSVAARFVDSAHAHHMRVVAWYLPSLAKPRFDLTHAIGPIRFRTPHGGRFDSFALDIEASVVKSVPLRNARLLALSARLRDAVGPSYPLGAIIPSPRGMQHLPKYWPGFPYTELGTMYDVFLPMGYFSYRPHDLGGAFGYTVRNVELIRDGTGLPNVPVHPIGGLGDASSTGQVHSFVSAARACGVVGASLYDFSTTAGGHWKQLARVPVGQRPPKASCS